MRLLFGMFSLSKTRAKLTAEGIAVSFLNISKAVIPG
jgi:hypothetical protein